MAVTGEKEVIDELDIEKLGRAGESSCVRHIFVGWLRVFGGVVVEHDDAFRVLAQCKAEDVAGAPDLLLEVLPRRLPLRRLTASERSPLQCETTIRRPCASIRTRSVASTAFAAARGNPSFAS
ncbi:MAG: hypothetical protein ABI779_25535 [Acidobacteriota bacterium]